MESLTHQGFSRSLNWWQSIPGICTPAPMGCCLHAHPHSDNSSEAKHTSNFTFKHHSYSPASIDKDVKRQPLEMKVTLHGAPGHSLLWGPRLCTAKFLLGGWEAGKMCWSGSYGDPQYVNPALRHGPCPGPPLSSRGMLSMLCCIRSRFEVQKHCFMLCFSSCVRGHELTAS